MHSTSLSSIRSYATFLLLLTLGSQLSVLAAQEDDFFPGLLGKYAVGEASVEKVDEVLSFDWGSSAPDERLPSGPFRAEWSGNLLVRLPGFHKFHVFVSGDATVEIDGTEILAASEQWGFVSGESFQLSAGDHEIRVTYSTPFESGKSRSKLAVFWSSDQFTLEPLPADVLYRDEFAAAAATQQHGRRLFDSLRCAACHQDGSATGRVPVLKAPTLNNISAADNRAVLSARLTGHWGGSNKMPGFNFNTEERQSVIEYLLSVGKGAVKKAEFKTKEGDISEGFRLLNSLGCVACHVVPSQPGLKLSGRTKLKLSSHPSPIYNGPSLENVGFVRTSTWIDRWLQDPVSLNADHRMPEFDLSKDERRQLVAALGQAKGFVAYNGESIPATSSAAKGKRLIEEANCAACHRIPGIKASVAKDLTLVDTKVTSGCLEIPEDPPGIRVENPNGSGRRIPSFAHVLGRLAVDEGSSKEATDREALVAWINSRNISSRIGIAERGRILVERNGCISCHDRNNARGLSAIANQLQKAHPDLAGQSQGLIPPSLTAVGDKLEDGYLARAVAGEQKDRRLPWLLVRMPKFDHSDADRAAIVEYFKTTDRIPAEADSSRQDVLAQAELSNKTVASTEELLLGNTLIGAGGFNCVACHKAGAFEPRNVALGTRGSDIMTMGDRIRPRFFHRWMKNPIRVVAGIEMPAIKTAMPDVLDASLPKQIGTIWKALSDDRFTPPTVTSRFEQVVNVSPNGPPRIIRDVFTIGAGKNRDAVARAMAIGFPNGHNILIDLNDMQVRQWTMGEYARQRTEGKSWYWDMPGFEVSNSGGAEVPFRMELDGQVWVPLADEGRVAELVSYQSLNDGVEITIAWHFIPASVAAGVELLSSEPHFAKTVWEANAKKIERVVTVHRLQQAEAEDGGSGWTHLVEVKAAPPKSVLKGHLSTFKSVAEFQSNGTDIRLSQGGWRLQEIAPEKAAVVSHTLSQRIPLSKQPLSAQTQTSVASDVTSTPGFDGQRLPIATSVMPTSMAWLADGRLVFTSLKGHVWITDANSPDRQMDLRLFEEGLASPFGILADGNSIIVAHKPEILRLRDMNGDGKADAREVVASGWGFNDNYHDWTGGMVRDRDGNIFAGLGSDYSQKNRPKNQDRWRGGVVKIDPSGIVSPMGMSMRYPMGLAIDAKNRLFATDNQGVQNTFNEINHIVAGRHYGVPSTHQPADGLIHESPAIMVPHPWTRSVNSILFLPEDFPVQSLRGHGIGCEYDSRFLIRFTVQEVDGVIQGASYPFSRPNLEDEAGKGNFIGPICSAVSPAGEIFIGSIWDSGWQGGRNTGGISKLTASPKGLPNGIRELTATADGFVVEFFAAVGNEVADPANWSIRGYTRKWGGSYATPDSGQFSIQPSSIQTDVTGKKLMIKTDQLKAGYLYSLALSSSLADSQNLWPTESHYSMKVVPQK